MMGHAMQALMSSRSDLACGKTVTLQMLASPAPTRPYLLVFDAQWLTQPTRAITCAGEVMEVVVTSGFDQ